MRLSFIASLRSLLACLAPVAALFLICAGFFWKIVLTDQYTWLESPDLSYQVLPWLQMQAGEWRRGRIPLWDPYLWGGQSLIGQAQPGVAYPLNWLLFLMPLNNGWIRQSYLHWYFVVIHFMAAGFAYLLCRDLKRSRMASLAAGCAFALGGWVGFTDWPQMLNSAVWAPLVLMFLLRSLRGERPWSSAALSGACFGMAWLGGHHQIPIFLMLACGGIWLYQIFRRGLPDWRAIPLAALFLAFMLLVGAVQIWPAYEYGKLSKRWVNAEEPKGWNEPVPYSVHSQYSLIPTSLLAILFPGYNRNGDPFIGIAALTLALLGMALAWREFPARVAVGLATGGLLFSLGRNNVLHGLLYALVPMVEKARTPSFAVFIYHFGIIILIAYGIDYLSPSNESRWVRLAPRLLLGVAAVMFLILAFLVTAQKAPGEDRFAVVALVAVLLAGVIYGWRSGTLEKHTAALFVLGLMLIEFGNVSGYHWPNREERNRNIYLPKMTQHSDIAQFLRGLPWPVRMEVSDREIPYNFGDWYGIDQFGGFVASLPLNLLRLPWHTELAKQMFGVNYTVKRENAGPDQELVFESSTGLKVYWNRRAFPRAWVVHRAEQVSSGDITPIMEGIKPFDLRSSVFLLEPVPELQACDGSDQVRLLRRNSGRVTIEADLACRGMVVLGDSFFPGWRAWVDGAPARIWEANGALRGVVVEGGKHMIEMRYLPLSVLGGLALTLFGLTGAAGLAIIERRREAKP